MHDPLYPGHRATWSRRWRVATIPCSASPPASRGAVWRACSTREGWQQHFVTIQTADDHPSKPHPSMILSAMAETGVDPASTLMVGDTTYDIEMARSAGVGAIGVGWGYHEAERLMLAGADTVVATSDALVAAIDARLAAREPVST